MLDVNAIVEADPRRLTPEAIATLAQQMLGPPTNNGGT